MSGWRQPVWPKWAEAEPLTPVLEVRTGRRGVLVGPVPGRRHPGAIVEWDPEHPLTRREGRVRAYVPEPTFELRPVESIRGGSA